ncbi:hypothetical protein NW752_007315, partial [Fusarium irregulare]
ACWRHVPAEISGQPAPARRHRERLLATSRADRNVSLTVRSAGRRLLDSEKCNSRLLDSEKCNSRLLDSEKCNWLVVYLDSRQLSIDVFIPSRRRAPDSGIRKMTAK